MPTENLQIVERLGWEGVVGWQTAIVIAAVLAAIAAWALWRERDAVGRGWAAAFWVLRAVAFGIVLWMLAGPTWLHIDRSSTNQNIAIFADNSESMEIIDPTDVSESVRWALAVSGAADDSPIVRCDRLSVALGAALASSEQLARFVAEHRSGEELERLAASIRSSLRRAAAHAEAIMTSLEGRDASLAERASRIAALLEGPVGDSIAAIQQAVTEPKKYAGEDVTARLETLLENVTSARRRAAVLASDLAQQPLVAAAAPRQEIDRMTRREKESKVLDHFEQDLKEVLSDDVRVSRFQFVDSPAPVSADAGWTSVLKEVPRAAAESSRLGQGSNDDPDAAMRATNLSAVLEQLARSRSTDSTRLAFVYSDGRHNDSAAPPPQEVARGLAGLPVYFVPIGNSAALRDVLVHRVEAPTAVAEKDTAVIDVIITAFESDGDACDVVLRREGVEIERKTIEFTGDRSDARVRFQIQATELGRHEYVVEVEPLEDDVNNANNYMPVAFDVVREHVRILLADSVARWEHRYLSQLFRRDSHVECDELLFFPQLTGTGRLANDPKLPTDVAVWATYDVVILGDLDAQQLTPASQAALEEYVSKRGGNLIVIAGRDAMPSRHEQGPLMRLLPVEFSGQTDPPQGYTLQLTDEGRIFSALLIEDSGAESRQVWQQIFSRNPVHWLSEYSRAKPTARTLIGASIAMPGAAAEEQADRIDAAFLCWQRVGAGRVMYISAPVTYSLRFRQGDTLHHRFWGQMLRWITAAGAGAGTDMVRLQTDRMQYSDGEPVEVTVWLKDKAGQPLGGQAIQVEARTFEDVAVTAELTPDPEVAGRYFAVLPKLPAGAYNVTVQGSVISELMSADPNTEMAKAVISVRATDNIEMLNTQCNRPLLEQLAKVTGGQVIPPTAVEEVLQLVSFAPEVKEQTVRTPLWNRWSYLIIVLGCLFTEWVVRKAKGLV
jgi:hypothetical protein